MMRKLFFILLIISCKALFADPSGIERLMEGNKRFVQDMLEHPNRTSERREALVAAQEPFAVIVSCSDSRVSPEIVFDQGVGDLFVVRVAGNVIGPLELESVEYSVVDLHSSVVVVLGHQNCGAIDAVIQGKTKEIAAIAALIEPSVKEERGKKAEDLLEASVKANARRMKNKLLKESRIKKLVKKGKVEIYAGYYDLKSGTVELLN